MREQPWSSYSYRPAQQRTLSQQFTKVEEIPCAKSYRPAQQRTLSQQFTKVEEIPGAKSYRPAQQTTFPQQFTKVEEIPGGNSYRPARRRNLSPLARIGVLVPIVLVLLVYTKTWDIAPRFATQWFATQWFTAPKPISVPVVQPSRPTFSRSSYIESSVDTKLGDMQTLAQQDVQWMVTSQQCSGNHYPSFVLLDFGEPHTFNGIYGTYSVKTNLFWADTDIADAARQYMLTWHAATSVCKLKLAIGLSNHHECAHDGPSCSIQEVGTRWAATVNGLNTWVHSQGYDQQIQVWGAYDAETTWDGADKTRQFVDGFNGNDTSKVPLVDFGDMRQGDPLIDPDTGQAEQRWTDEDRYYVAWKAKYDVPLPEIYDPSTLHDWVSLQQNYHDMNFLGIMTEACSGGERLAITDPRVDCGSVFNGYGFPPSTAWSQLKQNMRQQNPLNFVTSMPVPF